jgi:putative transcriptional regulator
VKNTLRVLRAEYGWSQAELAERLGVSRQTVNAVETGKYDPSLPLAFRIARLFGSLIEEIFDPEESRSSVPAPSREGVGNS